MGRVIYLEPYLIAKEEERRHHTLQAFPWYQVEQVKIDYFDSLTRFWPKQRRIMLDEATVRLLYESFALGYQGKLQVGEQHRDELVHDYRPLLEAVIEQITADFDLFRGLSNWRIESILTLFDRLAVCWFLKGVDTSS